MKINKLNVLLRSAFMFLAVTLVGCSDDDDSNSSLNYASFEGRTVGVEVRAGETLTQEINVYSNISTDSDRVYTLGVVAAGTTAVPANYNLPATVTIPAGSRVGTFEMQVVNLNLGDGKDLVLSLLPEAGKNVGENLVVNISQFCTGTKLRLDFTFDPYPTETSWELYDAAGTLLYSGGPYATGTSTFSKKLCLQSGNYILVVYDQYGDGIAPGFYQLSELLPDGNEISIAKNGTFGTEDIVEFTID
jgi:hypothetical protein